MTLDGSCRTALIQPRSAAQDSTTNTFKAVADEWLLTKKHALMPATWARDRRQIYKWVVPYLGSKPIAAIGAPDLLAVLKKIEAKGVIDTAHRSREVCGRVFRYAIATGRAKHDIAADLVGALAPRMTTHHAAIIDPVKVGELLRAINGYDGQPTTAAALRLAPYVFVRPTELRAAEWTEMHLDGEHSEWRIPAERMKCGDSYRSIVAASCWNSAGTCGHHWTATVCVSRHRWRWTADQ